MKEFKQTQFSKLKGHIIEKIEVSDEIITFYCENDITFCCKHDQDCCEDVHLSETIGDIDDLLYCPVMAAEEVSSGFETPKNINAESYIWTFYNVETQKGFVTFRWYGESNGYYSESVSTYWNGY